MLEQLRRFDAEKSNLEEMLALSAFAKTLSGEYSSRQLSIPEWLTGTQKSLNHEIMGKVRDQLEKRKRELLSQASGLESAEEKRKRIASELEAIDAQLGVASV